MIATPENQGDLHLKMLLSDPHSYSVNKTLVEYFIRAYHEILWSGEPEFRDKLELDILAGEHREQAFVEIKTDIVS